LPIDSNIAVLCDLGKVEECQIPEFSAVVQWIENKTRSIVYAKDVSDRRKIWKTL
jgi:hypothetical protein